MPWLIGYFLVGGGFWLYDRAKWKKNLAMATPEAQKILKQPSPIVNAAAWPVRFIPIGFSK